MAKVKGMFVETTGRFDALMAMFAYYPKRAIRLVIKRKGKILKSYLVVDGAVKKIHGK